MSELLKLNENGTVDGRYLWSKLYNKGKFADWWKRVVLNKYKFEENVDFVKLKTIVNGGGLQYDYQLSIDMAKELCMLSATELGRTYRKYLLEVEKKANEQIKLTVLQTLSQNCETEFNTAILELVSKYNELKEQLERTNKLENTYCLSDVCCKFKDCSPIDISHELYMDNYTDYRLNGKFPTEYAPDSMVPVTDRYGRAYVRFKELYWISEYIKSKGYELK